MKVAEDYFSILYGGVLHSYNEVKTLWIVIF